VATANFAQVGAAYRYKHGVEADTLKRAVAHVSVKSHANGARNPKAHLRKAITEEQRLKAPTIAALLGLFDCCGVCDEGSAVRDVLDGAFDAEGRAPRQIDGCLK